jgi:hypothetical protein
MTLEQLREQFLVDDDVPNEKLEQLIQKALPYCIVRKNGSVELRRSDLSGKQQVKVTLTARFLASKLDESIVGDVTVEQLSEYTGLPKDQAAARAKECLDERFADRSSRGSYKARPLKIEEFLNTLKETKDTKRAS